MTNYSIKSHAKVNIFLKVTGKRGSYHELLSRFVRLPDLYDTICFERDQCQSFNIVGTFSCAQEKNLIFLAYKELLDFIPNCENIINFFKNYKVVVNKQIKECGGLGGGPSNAAAFLRLVNDTCRLGLSIDELALVGSKVGADVPFFIHDTDSANIKGIGEIVEPCNENIPILKLFTPNIQCSTTNVYSHFRQFCYKEPDYDFLGNIEHLKSREILETFTAMEANDLCQSTVTLYPEMNKYLGKGWFMSGSGSTIFCLDKLIKK